MTKPESFILTSDQATLKNDGEGSLILPINGSPSIPPLGSFVYSTESSIGRRNAGIISEMNTNLYPSRWFLATSLFIVLRALYSIDGNTYDFPTTANLFRISPTVLILEARIYNELHDSSIQITGGYQTVTASVRTFLSPFN